MLAGFASVRCVLKYNDTFSNKATCTLTDLPKCLQGITPITAKGIFENDNGWAPEDAATSDYT